MKKDFFDPTLREWQVRLSSVIFTLVEFLHPKSILIYGRDEYGLGNALRERYPYDKIYDYDLATREKENLPADKVDLVINIDFSPETVECISKISSNVIFCFRNVESVSDTISGEVFKKYLSAFSVFSDLSHLNNICLTFDLPQEIENQCNALLQGNISYIDRLEDLLYLVRNSENVVFVPGMRGGKSVLDWLEYSGNLEHIDCFATANKKCMSTTTETLSEKNLPLLQLDCLLHFRESGVFIVTMNPIFHGEVYAAMTKFGFKNVFFLGVNAYNQIIEESKKIITPDKIMQRFMYHVTEKLNKLELLIEEQNELCAVNGAAFERYRNFFRDRKIVIVGGGPTAKYYTPLTDAVHIGVNFAWRGKNIPLDFLFTNDKAGNDVGRYIRVEEGFNRIKDRVFIGRRLQHVRDGVFFDFPNEIALRKDNVSIFYLDSVLPYCTQQLYQDICRHPLAHFSSTVFNAIHFALFTSPAELYLVGCDMTHAGHFYGPEDSSESLRLNRMKVGYARMKAFADRYYPDTKIISINPVNLKGLFVDIYTDEYKKSLEAV